SGEFVPSVHCGLGGDVGGPVDQRRLGDPLVEVAGDAGHALPGVGILVPVVTSAVDAPDGHVVTSCWARRTTATASASASQARGTSASSALAHVMAMDSSCPMPSPRISRAVLTSPLTSSAAWAKS